MSDRTGLQSWQPRVCTELKENITAWITIADSITDNGIILVVIERFEKQHLPWISDIKDKLDQGEMINDIDMQYLSDAINDARALLPYIDKHPEYESLIAKVMHYYKIITDEALANER